MAEKEPHSSSYGTPGDDSALRDQCSRVQAKIVAAREKLRLVQASFEHGRLFSVVARGGRRR